MSISFVELPGDGFVDTRANRALPERRLFLKRIETIKFSRACEDARLANRKETAYVNVQCVSHPTRIPGD